MNIQMLVQPALVGALVFTKDVLIDDFLPDNPHVWVDIATNVFSKFVSQFLTEEFIVPNAGTLGLALEPAMHGAINGGVKSQFSDVDSLTSLGAIESGTRFIEGRNRRIMPTPENYTFENGFLEGAAYNAVSIAGGMGIQEIIDRL
jgi:hypothetical protein